jgi:hypothetical protein
MSNNNVNTLAADTICGVYVSEIPSGSEVLSDYDFLDALSTVADGDTIYGSVSDHIAKLIDDEYGIR